MAPPPNSGDATNKHDNDDDPLGGMDPMAWLESLAARQGAKPEELVTAANLDIPVLPADTVIDEPGYTPGYDTGKSAPAKAEAAAPKPAAPQPVAPKAAAPEPAASTASSDDLLGGMDPMAWLESLAARQGAKPEELVTAANLDIPVLPADTVIDEPGYTPGYDTGKSAPAKAEAAAPKPAAPQPVAPKAAAPEPAASTASSDDLLGGMDPMAWLESLAARQGAKPEELVTAANLDIPVLPADTVIDEPGYTPGYDTGKSAPAKAEAAAPKPAAPQPVAPKAAAPEPAASTASSDDLLGGMDPMAWLESLAARQGAKPEELVTAANLDIPVLPADTVIDEPGYTPGYDTGKSAPAKAEAAAPKPAAPQPVAPKAAAPEPAASTASSDDLLGGMDPMAWLESLAARQGAKPEELVTAANLDIPVLPADTVIDEPGYTPGYDTGKSAPAKAEAAAPKPAAPQPVAPKAAAPEPAASTASSDDLLGGMDPMAWLESLAARQGAKPEELVTAANLDIPVLPADTVIDEPGYVDYDPFGGSAMSREPVRPPEPATPPPPIPEPVTPGAGEEDLLSGMDALAWLESLGTTQEASTFELSDSTEKLPTGGQVDQSLTEEAETVPGMSFEEAAALLGVESTEAVPSTDDILGGMDPLAWLESLAARQGANPDELVTGSRLELPESPIDDELAEYSSFAATTETTPESGGLPMEAESTLSWLEELAREQAQTPDMAAPETAPVAEAPSRDAGGASADISEVQAWLDEQAQALELTRLELEAEETVIDTDRPAEAGEIPSWLRESMVEAPAPSPAAPVLSEDIAMPVAPEDLPSWLTQPEAEAGLGLDLDLIASLTGATPPVVETIPEEPIPALGEIEALTQPGSPDEVDSWAEALDEEYERKQAGDESVPDWYLEAMTRAEEEIPQPTPEMTGKPVPMPEAGAEFAVPDWLGEVGTEEPVALPGDIPDWLRGVSPEPVASAPTPVPAEIPPDWLDAQGASIAPEELPDWLRPAVVTPPEPEPERAAPVVPPPEPVQVKAPEPERTVPVKPEPVLAAPVPPAAPARPREPVVKPPEPAPVTIKPAQPVPVAHQERLQQARGLVSNNQHLDSLGHYQALIDAAELLEETRGDLRDMVNQHPDDPRLRRMLGDTHMRLGDLQAALDTYRSALDQL